MRPLACLVVLVSGAGMLPADNATTAPADARTTAPAAPAEFRVTWLTGGEILQSSSVLAARYRALKKANFNVMAINTIYDGAASYPNSRFLSLHPFFEKRPDTLAMAMRQIAEAGLTPYILTGSFVVHKSVQGKPLGRPPSIISHAELLQTDKSGSTSVTTSKDTQYVLCPSNPASHEFLAGLYAEAVLRYRPGGLIIHNFHYWSKDHCYCSYCREHFRKDTGIVLGTFDPKSTESRAWTDWKREQLVRGMKTVAATVRAASPQTKLVAYGLTKSWERSDRAQPWETWLKDGSVDYVIVLLRDKDVRSDLEGVLRVKGVDPSRLIAGLAGTHPSVDLLRNVELTRRKGLAGHYISVARDLKNDDLFGLMDGPYALPAGVP